MSDRNVFNFETPNGLKTLEIICTDILEIKEPADILVVSAFQNSYLPTHGTLIGALDSAGISVDNLARRPSIDMRNTQHVWMSQKIVGEKISCGRLACVELSSNTKTSLGMNTVRERIKALFAMLAAANYSGIPVKSVVMPVLGAHVQDYSPKLMAELLLKEGYRALENIPDFVSLQIAERNRERYSNLSTAFNAILGRNPEDIAKNFLYEETVNKIKQMQQDFIVVKNLRGKTLDKHNLDEIISSFENIGDDPRYMVAFKCRRLAEIISIDLLSSSNPSLKENLAQKIDRLCNTYKLPVWIRHYLHTMRVFGNEGVHIKALIDKRQRKIDYPHPNENDINILLLCSAEVLKTWRKLREKISS